jgi:signal recognition particle receptor subunit beta
MHFDEAQRELTLKVVYYGPALSGKTTNLQMLHQMIVPTARGRVLALDTADERTLFFDLLPVFFEAGDGLSIKVRVFSVPGQFMHRAARRLLLAGVDAVAFVADSQVGEARTNTDAWTSMMADLREQGIDPKKLPVVVQFNKRDLPDVRSDDDLADLRARAPQPVISAIATRGEGVLETLFWSLILVFRVLSRQAPAWWSPQLSEGEFIARLVQHVAAGHAERLAPTLMSSSLAAREKP